MRIVVDLPAPLGPSRPTHVPYGRSRSRPSTAVIAPKRLTTPRRRIASSVIVLRGTTRAPQAGGGYPHPGHAGRGRRGLHARASRAGLEAPRLERALGGGEQLARELVRARRQVRDAGLGL